ncbi:unnamed protein product [Protopolystoma xenopodis]|uniref:Uncharacterized protein n=1 Tax=Protopolystoma xenopodis TaxID=117903 RepID=A0A448WDE9_9PLAT|nr:unnamed protein product [Protopolystoma xenopodis]
MLPHVFVSVCRCVHIRGRIGGVETIWPALYHRQDPICTGRPADLPTHTVTTAAGTDCKPCQYDSVLELAVDTARLWRACNGVIAFGPLLPNWYTKAWSGWKGEGGQDRDSGQTM